MLNSIITEGRFSCFLKEFILLCLKYALAALNRNYSKEAVLNLTGLSPNDIAYDIIADLFEQDENGKFPVLVKYYKNSDNLSELTEDEIKAKMYALIISRTNQRLSEMKEECGEIFFKVRKAVRIYIQRNNEKYKCIIYNETEYVYTCDRKTMNMDKQIMPCELLLNSIYAFDYRNYQIPVILESLFAVLNRQAEFAKTTEKNTLFKVITDFYKQRLINHVSESENILNVKNEINIDDILYNIF